MNAYPELFEDRLKIVFVHLPKTGGKTFRQICKRQFKNCKQLRIMNIYALEYLTKLSLEERATFDFIHGHFPLSFLPEMPKRFRYFTWLRDPVNRTISLYNYWKHSKRTFKAPGAATVHKQNMTFEDFITTNDDEIKYWQYPYLNYLGLGIKNTGNPVEIMERGIEQAARVLLTHFDFVGITERYDEGLEYLQKTFGFRTDHTIQNVTPAWAKAKTGVTDEQRDRLREWLKPEYIIYEFAKKIFEERIDRGPERRRIYESCGSYTMSQGKQGNTQQEF